MRVVAAVLDVLLADELDIERINAEIDELQARIEAQDQPDGG